MNFDKEYFTSINYTDYLDRYDRYEKLAIDITDLLNKVNLLKEDTKILDFGCAVGLLIQALTNIGYKNTFGYDISEWALKKVKEKGLNVVEDVNKNDYDVTFCLDVLEHMYDEDVNNFLKNISSDVLVLRIPVSTDGGETFHLSVSRRDPTHINCKSKDDWQTMLKNHGYRTFLNLNLYTIYDTEGVWSCICLRDKEDRWDVKR
jgi:cyclopropane fatty-acyl-phospholipid synthase-like methyltransferase